MSSGTPGPPRIVLIDDLEDIRDLERMVLTRDGFEIVGEAADAVEGAEVVEAHRPDVVVLDVNMPAMTGLEALPRIRTVSPGSKIVLFSSAGPDSRVEAIMLGADAYLDKTELHDLGATVRRVMRSSGVRASRR